MSRSNRKIYTRYSEKSTKGTQMDETDETTETAVEDLPVVHQFGKLMFGSVAAFAANKLADRVYDGAIRAYRARKSS